MLFLTLFIVMVCVTWAFAGWPLFGGKEARSRAPEAEAQPGSRSAAGPQSLEGVLAAQLVAGEISGSQYRRAVERLAARDEERHPMAVPPEIGSADA